MNLSSVKELISLAEQSGEPIHSIEFNDDTFIDRLKKHLGARTANIIPADEVVDTYRSEFLGIPLIASEDIPHGELWVVYIKDGEKHREKLFPVHK